MLHIFESKLSAVLSIQKGLVGTEMVYWNMNTNGNRKVIIIITKRVES